MTAALGDPAELLVVLVDKSSRMAGDVANRSERHPVSIPKAAEAPTNQNAMDGRWRSAEEWTQAIRAIPDSGSSLEDLGFGSLGQASWRTMWSTRSVEKSCFSTGSIPSDPLVCRRPADVELLGNVRRGPAFPEDTSDDQLATEDCEFRPRMCHESPPAWVLRTPQTEIEDSRSVNNVCGDYI